MHNELTTISIFDPETGDELGYDEDGEVCITGPNTMLGYFANQEATDAILRKHSDGRVWVHTGDIGHMTKNGRKKLTFKQSDSVNNLYIDNNKELDLPSYFHALGIRR